MGAEECEIGQTVLLSHGLGLALAGEMTKIRAEIRLKILSTKACNTSRYLDIFWYSDLRKNQHIVTNKTFLGKITEELI